MGFKLSLRQQSRLRIGLIALSLANLCFAKTWAILGSKEYWFYSEALPHASVYLAYVLNVLCLTAIFFVLLLLAQGKNRSLAWIAKIALGVGVAVVLNGLRAMIPQISIPHLLKTYKPEHVALVFTLLLAFAAFIVLRFRRRVVHAFAAAILILAPFAFFTVGMGVKNWVRNSRTPPAFPLAERLATSKQHRVLWLLFDEADQHLAFEGGLKLPNLEALKKKSFVATHAYSPAINTERSIPALLTGRLVMESHPEARSRFQVRFADAAGFENWADAPNIFSQARERGLNTELVGWYLPYCRMIHKHLTKCHNFGLYNPMRAESLWGQMWIQVEQMEVPRFTFLRLFLTQKLHLNWPVPRVYESQVDRHERILETAKAAAVDPSIQLAFLHFSVPHPPFIYNRERGQVTQHGDADYFGNLVLMDNIVGELLEDLRKSGLEETTDILITSDHWFRFRAENEQYFAGGPNKEKRIPFILHMHGQTQGVVYDAPFNTIVSSQLILNLLDGKLNTAHHLAQWMQDNSKISEPTYAVDP